MEGDCNALKKTQSFFGNNPNIQLVIETIKYINIPSIEEAKCWECDKALKQYPFYWLKWEEGTQFGCRLCVEAVSTLEGHHYKYEKNSVLLNGNWKILDPQKLGKNIQPIHPKHI